MSDLIKQCDECKLNECINCEHSWADIQELKKQLAKKDKEIEKLNLMIETLSNHDTEIEQQIRHQVCEEIREKFKSAIKEYADLHYLGIEKVCFVSGYRIVGDFNWEAILDQIEKGESGKE